MIFNITQDKMREMALHWIDPNDGNVIELGCSSGNFAELLYKANIKNYIGIDILKNKIIEAKTKLPKMHFMCCDIISNLYLLGGAKTFVSFQCLEHIEEDFQVLNAINEGTKCIISVPNSPYKGHVRWYELEGWKDRFSRYIDFDYACVIQNPKKKDKRAFLFRGLRNGHQD